jgi:hypothetical protein
MSGSGTVIELAIRDRTTDEAEEKAFESYSMHILRAALLVGAGVWALAIAKLIELLA